MQHTLPMLYYCSVFYFRHEICFLIIFLSLWYVIGLEQCHPHIFRHVRLALLIVTLMTCSLNFCIWNCFLAWIVIFSLNSVSSHSTSMPVYEEEGYLERMCVCSCVCACVYTCACVYVCFSMCVHVCVPICVCVCVCPHLHVYVCLSVCLCMCVHSCMFCVCVHVHMCLSVCVCEHVHVCCLSAFASHLNVLMLPSCSILQSGKLLSCSWLRLFCRWEWESDLCVSFFPCSVGKASPFHM